MYIERRMVTIRTIGRRNRANLSGFTLNVIDLKNPWIVACWSLFNPGFGHVRLCKFVVAWVLVIWELVTNFTSHLNLAIIYTFTGHPEMAKSVLNKRMLFFYLPVYVYAFYDSYRSCVEVNNQYILADREDAKLKLFHIGPLEINFLEKRSPIIAVLWSLFIPGLGQMFNNRITSGIFVLTWWMVIMYLCHGFEGMYYTFYGQFDKALHLLHPEWLLFLPSMYGFAAYDAYCTTIEYNKLFEKEKSQFLREQYQNKDFPMWIKTHES